MTKNNILVLPALIFALMSASAEAQTEPSSAPPPASAPKYSAAELEKLAAPIALHPDPLIAILLPASVYPLEIVQAARFVKDTNNIPKVDEQPWDENVKALAKFPDLLQKLNDDLTWTMDLGQAFVDQQKELMDTIQMLRTKANSTGVLKTTPQQVIVVTNTVIEKTVEQRVVYVTNTVVQIQPSNPQVVYVPTYPPTIYYPPPPAYTGPPPIVTFAAGMALGAIIANNTCDWHGGGIYVGHHGVAVVGGGYHGGGYHGDVDIDINRNVNINKNTVNNVKTTTTAAQKWQPNQSRMSTTGAGGTRSTTQSAQSRGWSSGATPTARTASQAARPGAASSFNRSSPSPSKSNQLPAASTARSSAFGGVSNGANAQQFSSRGASSRGGGRSFSGRRR